MLLFICQKTELTDYRKCITLESLLNCFESLASPFIPMALHAYPPLLFAKNGNCLNDDATTSLPRRFGSHEQKFIRAHAS